MAGLLACFAAGALPARQAHAAAPPITPYVDRGMLYGPLQAGISFALEANTAPIEGSYADTSIDVALGLTRYLTVDGSLGTISLSPDGRYRGPRAGLWLGLLDTPPLELDVTAHLAFGVGDESALHQIDPGAVAVFRIADEVRVDAGAYLPVSLDGASGPGLRAPAALAVQLNPYIHASVSSGLTIPSLREGQVIVPLGLSLGATLPLGAGGYAVLSPSLTWPSFAAPREPGASGPGPTVVGASLSIVTPP